MQLKSIIEGALLAAGRPLTIEDLAQLFEESERPAAQDINAALAELSNDCRERALELREVASGYRLQVRQELAPWIARLWEEKPPRYSRAMLETLALIAYRQPITRGDIEEIRGVAVNPNIIRALQERDWVRVVGHRDVPGRPELLATTRQFLDYFGLSGLDSLPTLAEIKDFEQVDPELSLAIETPSADAVQSADPAPEASSSFAAQHADSGSVDAGDADPGDDGSQPRELLRSEAAPGNDEPENDESSEQPRS
jgi:segregation and condensation protein B